MILVGILNVRKHNIRSYKLTFRGDYETSESAKRKGTKESNRLY